MKPTFAFFSLIYCCCFVSFSLCRFDILMCLFVFVNGDQMRKKNTKSFRFSFPLHQFLIDFSFSVSVCIVFSLVFLSAIHLFVYTNTRTHTNARVIFFTFLLFVQNSDWHFCSFHNNNCWGGQGSCLVKHFITIR